MVGQQWSGPQKRVFDDRLYRNILALEVDIACLQLGQVHHSLNEMVQPVGLLLNHLAQLLPHLLGNAVLANHGDGGLDGGQRSAQIMGHGIQQGSLQLFALAQILCLGCLRGSPLKISLHLLQLFLLCFTLHHPLFQAR